MLRQAVRRGRCQLSRLQSYHSRNCLASTPYPVEALARGRRNPSLGSLAAARHSSSQSSWSDPHASDGNASDSSPMEDTAFTRLQKSTRQILTKSTSSSELETIQSLLAEWERYLPKIHDKHDAIQSMYDLASLQKENSEPFRLVLRATSQAYPHGPTALRILNQWNAVLAGDLEHAPRLQDYHTLLHIYVLDQESSEGAHVALEVLQQLQEWQYTMTPTLETYHLVVQNVVKAVPVQDYGQAGEWLDALDMAMKNCFYLTQLDVEGGQLSFSSLRQLTPQEYRSALLTVCEGLIAVSILNRQGHEGLIKLREWSRALALMLSGGDQFRIVAQSDDVRDKISQSVSASQEVLLADRSSRPLVVSLTDCLESIRLDGLPAPSHFLHAIRAANMSAEVDPTRADGLMRRLEETHEEIIATFNLDSTEKAHIGLDWCHALLEAYIHNKQYHRVDTLWDQMVSHKAIHRNEESFALFLKALATQKSLSAAERAHAIWRRMVDAPPERRYIQPDTRHYLYTMQAWSSSRHPKAAARCQEVFDRLRADYVHSTGSKFEGLRPSALHYAELITAYGVELSRSKDPSKQEETSTILATLVHEMGQVLSEEVFEVEASASLLAALVRSQAVQSVLKAEELLRMWISQDETAASVTLPMFTTVMYGLASAGESERCVDIFQLLERVYESSSDERLRPDSAVYRALLRAAVNASEASGDTGQAAEKVLSDMESAASHGLADSPDRKVFAAVMKAHLRARAPDAPVHIQKLLDRMEESYLAGNFSAKPDAHSMTLLLRAHAYSDHPDKASICWDVLNQMIQNYKQGDLEMKPSVQAFSAVLGACASTSVDSDVDNALNRKEHIVRICLMVMNELYSGGYDNPDGLVFTSLFKAFTRHIDDGKERHRVASVFFQRCCQEGHVNSRIIEHMKRDVPLLYNKLPAAKGKDELKLPPEWTRNVPRRHAYRYAGSGR